MIVRRYSCTSSAYCALSSWRIPYLARTTSWAAKHVRGVLGGWNQHKPRASPWQPTPYQWAPLPERAQDLPNEALERKDFGKFVQFFRQASPYIEGHRGRTFVIVIPGEVRPLHTRHRLWSTQPACYTCHEWCMRNNHLLFCLQVILHRHLLQTLLEDIQLLHGKSLE